MSKEFMGDLFLAENQFEESSQLMGKVNALHGIWKTMPEVIDEHLVSAIFGFKETRDAEFQDAVETKDRYFDYWQTAEEKRKFAEERADTLQNLLDQKMELASCTARSGELKGMED